ncbi:type II secretion system protein N [Metallibacterium scheffleri]|uniref:type II secretion system protein N n=1 Tax=Metallibacterium scheffleri TaxID=993689 RepID=UPI0010A046C6|nr:type II secretion system protein N [Metallibacterium scheffleri]
MSETARPRLRLGLVALNAALVLLLIGIAWWAKRPLPPLPVPSPAPVRPIRLAPLTDAPMPLALRGAYARAPLFNSDRKPDRRSAATASAPTMRGTPILTGVVQAPGLSLALIQVGTHRATALSKGDLVPGTNWLVQGIQPHHVYLDDGGQRLRLALKVAAPADAAETPAAPIATMRPPIPPHPLAIRLPVTKLQAPPVPHPTAVRPGARVAPASSRPIPSSVRL